jgi:hypothetical protein
MMIVSGLLKNTSRELLVLVGIVFACAGSPINRMTVRSIPIFRRDETGEQNKAEILVGISPLGALPALRARHF